MMGWTPAEVGTCTLAEFAAAFDGFAEFHGGKKAEGPSDSEYLQALAEEMAAGRA